MRNLPNSTRDQVLTLLSLLKRESTTKGWAEHKSTSYVLSGLNKHFSNMDSDMWDLSLKHGNLVEGSHWAIDRHGRQQSLLSALFS